MNLENIKQLIELLERHELDEIQYTLDKESIQLKKSRLQVTNEPQAIAHQPYKSTASQSNNAPEVKSVGHYKQVQSPIVGTYYAASAPDKAPFVKVGDTIDTGQVLCIIEAMKILNPVTSPYSGVVKKIHIRNESPVEYNQVLFDIEPL